MKVTKEDLEFISASPLTPEQCERANFIAARGCAEILKREYLTVSKRNKAGLYLSLEADKLDRGDKSKAG